MPHLRREFLRQAVLAAATARLATNAWAKPSTRLGIPGPFPGRVVSVHHPGGIIEGRYQAEPIRQMMRKGMMELTGAPSAEEAWRSFFEPGDVVGIKLNPVGFPHVISAAEVVHEIVAGIRMAGVKAADIVAYDRYRRQFLRAGFDKWLPEGVRWMAAVEDYDELQWDTTGYDTDHYIELPLVRPEGDPSNPLHRRSHAVPFLTREVNKLINLSLLKHHQSAGVTLALKNLSHGLVNNVSRSHATRTLNACGVFIPAVVDMPVIRQKVVLNILDGVQGAYHGGPGGRVKNYVWAHNTMYFATDPVAVDKVGWQVIDAKRKQVGMKPVIWADPDADSTFVNMQPEHVEIAGALGLGEYRDEKLDIRKIELS